MDGYSASMYSLLSPKSLPSQAVLNINAWILCSVGGFWLLLTSLYAWGLTTTSGPLSSFIPTKSSHAILVLQILSGGATLLMAQLINMTLEAIVWATASSTNGVPISSFFAISSCTGIAGLLELLRWKKNSVGKDHHHLWVMNRYSAPVY
jgi:hypothetical protein